MTDRNETKEKIKNISPETMSAAGFIIPARKTGYICPNCANGSGDDGTGIIPALLSNGWEYHCMKCDKSFDNIKLIAAKENLSELYQFSQILEVGKNLISSDFKNYSTQWNKSDKKSAGEIYEDIKAARANLKSFIDAQGGSWRGLTFETLDRFKCGFLKNWKATPKSVPSARIIIPTSKNHYLARAVNSSDKFSKQHAGEKEIFNAADLDAITPIIIVEGEIDCMSISQAAGVPCVALGGSLLSEKFKTQFENLSRRQFIVMLDNDEAGRIASVKITDKLNACGHKAVALTLSKNYNDANEFLQKNPAEFKSQIDSIMEQGKNLLLNLAEVTRAENNDDTDKPKMTRDIMKDCPINLLIPKKYKINYDGIKALNSDGNAKLISFTPIVITRSIQNNETLQSEIELAYYDRGRKIWRKFITEKSSITDSKKLLALTDRGLTFAGDTAKNVCSFLTALFAVNDAAHFLPSIISYSQPGWTENFGKFIYPTEGDGYIFKPKDYPIFDDAYKPHGDRDYLFGLLKRTLAASDKARIIIFAIAASPAVALMGCRNIQLHVWGTTQSGKTATMAAALALFGKPKELMGSFYSTTVAIERRAVLSNSMPFVVNEFQASLKDKDKSQRLTNFIYAVDEGRNKGRGTKSGGLQSLYRFNLSMVTSGEQPITTSTTEAGAKSRMLELYCKGKIVPEELGREIHVETNEHYGHFGRQWIEYLRTHREEIREHYFKHQKQLQSNEKIVRHDPIGAHLTTAAAIFTVGFHFCKCFGLEEFFSLVDEENFILELPGKQKILDVERAREDLSSFINSNSRSFIHTQKISDYDNRQEDFAADSFVCHGLIRNTDRVNFVAFYPKSFENIVKELGYSPERVKRDFVACGYIQTDKNGKITRPTKYYDHKQEGWILPRMIRLNWDGSDIFALKESVDGN